MMWLLQIAVLESRFLVFRVTRIFLAVYDYRLFILIIHINLTSRIVQFPESFLDLIHQGIR